MSSEKMLAVDTQAGLPTRAEQKDIVEVTDLVIKYGNTTAVNGVSFSIKAGEFLTLLGPSGCGKTTTLRAIAGLETPSSGEIRVGGRVVYSSKQGINIPAEKRNLSMVFQSYAIWPHLTAFENVVYGLRVRKQSREEIKRQGKWALDLVQMGQFGERRASALSGGQQQRIALARAVAFGAQVVLFDEPLSNLDANLRAQMRNEIKDLQRKLGVTSVYVTHDQEEALTMSDRIIVMSNGKIEQEATPDQLYDYPTNRFVAHFIGSANMVSGAVDELNRNGDLVDFMLEDGSRIRALDNRREKAGGESMMTVRAVYPQLSLVEDPGAINQWAGIIDRAIFSGDFIEYHVVVLWGTIVVRRPPTDRYEVSSSVFLKIDPSRCIVIEA